MLELFLNDTSAAIFTLDATGCILAANPYVEKVFGYASGELLGQSIDVIIPVNALNPNQDSMFTYWQAPGSAVVGAGEQLIGKHKNGSRFRISAYLSPLLSSKGLQVLCIVRNQDSLWPQLSEAAIILLDALEKEKRQIAFYLQTGLLDEMDTIYDQLKNKDQNIIDADRLLAMIDRGRSICENIYPRKLHANGLDKAISAHSQELAKTSRNLSISLNLMPERGQLDQRTRLVLFRAYQQAIANIFQHASASCVQILFTFDKDRIILEINDDGRGFELPESWQASAMKDKYGLIKTIMEVNALEGRITIDTSPGGGTSVRLELPNRSYHPEPFQG